MNTPEEFRERGYKIVDWIADYFTNIESFPVKPDIQPGEIKSQIATDFPEQPESFDDIFKDFEEKIVPGMTHWQHPGFMGYFPANNSFPSILAEMLTAGMGAQCMVWLTSPAAEELEELMMLWLRKAIGLPDEFTGVIQDTASTATLVAILSAREKYSHFAVNKSGFTGREKFRVYSSNQVHSSIDKAVRIAGIGEENLIKVPVNDDFSMNIDALKEQIEEDLKSGYRPLCIVSALGTTSSTACDSIDQIGQIAKAYDIWHHVDAAYLGTALILDEYRYLINGIENADSFVFNPHKWMMVNFDCSAYYVKDTDLLQKTFSIMPEYLKTDIDKQVNNYRDWGIQLGRRFRALKLWFVLRSFGLEGLKKKISAHIKLTKNFESFIARNGNFEILAPVVANLVCFRVFKLGWTEEIADRASSLLMSKVNQTGDFFLTHTKLSGKYTIRVVIGQTNVTEKQIESLIALIEKTLPEVINEVEDN
ncbi:pyridoxal phosphate-dependent decarboxylase family protein [Marinigracilibium pacificum]|uniref:Aspartate aminotransferase family protein n=1 Tax=Marinigracilibium pacificum TaxID=2729599 RepID=A0A848IWC3_9BACT|nr:pyridoxal-dependent decarboxylase [Marinigracilibium pacificum]NMM48813.1 aspartate aminotransferase family protein [Marinigracilibium pacificum]